MVDCEKQLFVISWGQFFLRRVAMDVDSLALSKFVLLLLFDLTRSLFKAMKLIRFLTGGSFEIVLL